MRELCHAFDHGLFRWVGGFKEWADGWAGRVGGKGGLIIIYKYIIIRMSENYFKLRYFCLLYFSILAVWYSLILFLFFSKYS